MLAVAIFTPFLLYSPPVSVINSLKGKQAKGYGVHARIIAVILFSILMIPIVRPQTNPNRERERNVLLALIGLLGALMLFLRLLKLLTC